MKLRSCLALTALAVMVGPGAAVAEESTKAISQVWLGQVAGPRISHATHVDGSGLACASSTYGLLSADGQPVPGVGSCPTGAKPIGFMIERFQRLQAAKRQARRRARDRQRRARLARQRAKLRAITARSASYISESRAGVPSRAPATVRAVIEAANSIADTPYLWGGGHASFESSAYDCSGAVSFALNGGDLLESPLNSTGLETWGEPGPGRWITVYANSGHTWVLVAGLAFDTAGGSGPRWHSSPISSTEGYVVRHPDGL